MNTAEREAASNLVTEVEVAIKTLIGHLSHDAYVQHWDKSSPSIRALNILQEAVGEPPTAGEKPQDTLDHDVELIDKLRAQRDPVFVRALNRDEILLLALRVVGRLEQRTEEVLQARIYTDYWIDKANSLQEHLNEAHDIEEDLLHRLKEKNA